MKKLLLTFFIFFLPTVQSTEERSITIKAKERRDLPVEAKKGSDTALLNTKYHAIIIGNNNYKHLPKLKTAIADAKGECKCTISEGIYKWRGEGDCISR